MASFRMLGPGDEKALEAFLLLHTDSSMILRSNLRAGGLVYQGKPYQADYMAAVGGNQIVGVAAHAWNGHLLLQAPEEIMEHCLWNHPPLGPWNCPSHTALPEKQAPARVTFQRREGSFGSLKAADVQECSLFPNVPVTCNNHCLG